MCCVEPVFASFRGFLRLRGATGRLWHAEHACYKKMTHLTDSSSSSKSSGRLLELILRAKRGDADAIQLLLHAIDLIFE